MLKLLRKLKNKRSKIVQEDQVAVNNTYADFENAEWDLVNFVKSYTRTSPERIVSLAQAINYIENNNIEGDIVECGVWRGGSMMAVAKCLLGKGSTNRKLYLYDTFEGMTEATEKDVSFKGRKASEYLFESDKYDSLSVWCYASLEDVRQNMKLTGYPETQIAYIKGKVEDTIPKIIPDQIAVLRLDTDWYESTKHELNYLYPKLVKGGILIIDDYGHWRGAKLATDEYFKENDIQIFLSRIDYTCRLAVKLS